MKNKKTIRLQASLAAALCALGLGGCNTFSDRVAVTAQDRMGSSVLFVSNRDGDQDIYLLDASGEDAKQLTNNDVADIEGVWSPDGSRILFTSLGKGNPDIYLMNADGTQLQRLTDLPGLDSSPQWAPDGRRICFVSDRERYLNVYVLDLESGETVNVSNTERGVGKPVWSPDGSAIAYEEVVGTKGKNIVLVAPDGSNKRKLTDDEKSVEFDLAWSPDGSRLAFAAKRKNHLDIYVIGKDGKDEQKLTDTQWLDAAPAWSPDGKSIAFLSTRDDGVRNQVYLMGADGAGQRRLSHSGAEEAAVTWSQSGQALYFVSFKDGNAEIYRMSPDGSVTSRLTDNIAYDINPLPHPAASGGSNLEAAAYLPEDAGRYATLQSTTTAREARR